MSDERPLGVIKDISGGFSYDRLAVFPDSMVLLKGTTGFYLLRSLQYQFGALGVLAFYPLLKRRENKQLAAISTQSAAQLSSANPKNRLFRYDQLLDVQLKKSFLSGQLTLKLADGTSKKLTWPKGANKHEQVAPILRQALGTKLSEVA